MRIDFLSLSSRLKARFVGALPLVRRANFERSDAGACVEWYGSGGLGLMLDTVEHAPALTAHAYRLSVAQQPRERALRRCSAAGAQSKLQAIGCWCMW